MRIGTRNKGVGTVGRRMGGKCAPLSTNQSPISTRRSSTGMVTKRTSPRVLKLELKTGMESTSMPRLESNTQESNDSKRFKLHHGKYKDGLSNVLENKLTSEMGVVSESITVKNEVEEKIVTRESRVAKGIKNESKLQSNNVQETESNQRGTFPKNESYTRHIYPKNDSKPRHTVYPKSDSKPSHTYPKIDLRGTLPENEKKTGLKLGIDDKNTRLEPTTRLQHLQTLSLKPTIPPSTLSQLYTLGYIILKNKLKWTPSQLHNFQTLINTNTFTRSIFNNNIGRNDNMRLSCPVNVGNRVENFVKQLFPNKHVCDWHVIKSNAGCSRQQFHCDYKPSAQILNCEPCDMPLIMLTSLSKTAKLIVKPNSLNYVNNVELLSEKVLEFSRGDLVVFRGDLVHCGSGYEKDNYRLHCYLDSPKVPREVGMTFKI